MQFKIVSNQVQVKKSEFKNEIQQTHHEIFPVNQEMTEVLKSVLLGRDDTMLMPYLYDGPKYNGDKVNGAALWDKFSHKTSYYLMHHEIELIKKFSANINADIGEEPTYIELGPGSKHSLNNKTIPLIGEGRNVHGYIAVDVSRYHIEQSIRVIRDAFPDIYYYKGVEQDFCQPGLERFIEPKPVAFLFGSTACNLPEKMENNIPMKTMNFFSNIRNFIGKDGYFIVTQDTNMDRVSLFDAYDTLECEEFCMNVLQRVKRDCDIQGFDPNGFDFETVWHEEQQFIGGYAVSKNYQFCKVGGRHIPIKKGSRINIYRSYKYSVEQFKRMGEMAGFKPVSIYMHHDGKVALHVWKA